MFKLLIAMLLLATPAMAVEWFAKPVQCDTFDVVTQLLIERGQEPLFAGLGTARVNEHSVVFPVVVFANPEDKSWHVIEYNVESDQACVVAVGNGLDFNVADWYYKKDES